MLQSFVTEQYFKPSGHILFESGLNQINIFFVLLNCECVLDIMAGCEIRDFEKLIRAILLINYWEHF
jgi:hypothetical protein